MRYWVYLDGQVPGNYEPEELAAIPGFGGASMVCPVEGGIEERNWRRAGQFPDLITAIDAAAKARPPAAPQAPVALDKYEPGSPKTPNDILNDSSARIFQHVSELMKELEDRRSEQALTRSLQRQVVDLKNEVLALRERNQYLQDRADMIPGFQERERKLEESTGALRSDIQERDIRVRELQEGVLKLERAIEASKASEAGLSEDLKRQAQVAEELSDELSQKDFTLAKAFGVIRRLEQLLGDILPGGSGSLAKDLPGYHDSEAAPEPEPAGPEIRVRETPPLPKEEEAPPAPEPAALIADPNLPPEGKTGAEEPVDAPPDVSAPPQPEPPLTDDAKILDSDDPPEPPRPDPGTPCPEDQTHPTPEPEPEEPALPPVELAPPDTSSGSKGAKTPPLPPEGEVTPLPPPWQASLGRFSAFLRKYLPIRPQDRPSENPKD